MSPQFYRGEAERMRRLAADQTEAPAVRQLLKTAAECDDLADDIERQSIQKPK